MRPPGITGGIPSHGIGRPARTCSRCCFNEAAGYYRRNLGLIEKHGGTVEHRLQ